MRMGAVALTEPFMKHQTVEQVRTVAAVHNEAMSLMSSQERQEHWARLLEQEPDRRLNTLYETEHCIPRSRETMRGDNSPISVAFADPILRAQGLMDDTYGQAKRFFSLSNRQMHGILCYCHFGETMAARAAAQAIRRVIAAESYPGWFTRLRQSLSGLRSGA